MAWKPGPGAVTFTLFYPDSPTHLPLHIFEGLCERVLFFTSLPLSSSKASRRPPGAYLGGRGPTPPTPTPWLPPTGITCAH
jgi:hypothetical protein